jgi:hypothetical protein
MSATPKRPLNRDRAWAYITLNISVPGWGSLKAGRIFAGIGEMVITFAGLFLLGAWVFEWINRIVQSEIGDTLPPVPPSGLWEWGVVCCIVSWGWTIVTCVSLIREAKAQEELERQNVPPRLADLNQPPGEP